MRRRGWVGVCMGLGAGALHCRGPSRVVVKACAGLRGGHRGRACLSRCL